MTVMTRADSEPSKIVGLATIYYETSQHTTV